MAKPPKRSAADFFPPGTSPDSPRPPSIDDLRGAAATCRGCDLYKRATQTVFGDGPATARVMFIGEQPGDQEDLAGAPFVGPAGKLLESALTQAGIHRTSVYVTNVVKHFKWRREGKRRLHSKPRAGEIRACRPWLDAEIARIKPRLIVCLGATAAQTLLGNQFRVTVDRGRPIETDLAPFVIATVHPSSILRAPDSEMRALEMKRFAQDLRNAARLLGKHG